MANPLDGISHETIYERKGRLLSCGLADEKRYFDQAEVLLGSPFRWRDADLGKDTDAFKGLTKKECASFEADHGPIWHRLRAQPWSMIQLIILCGLGAMVQGWDEAAVNGAQVYYQQAFGTLLHSRNSLLGLINGAPYLCCFFSCWLNLWLNQWLGRRGTIFFAAFVSAAFAFGQALSNDWWTMFILRLGLGLGIGPKSATIPIYAAECAPAGIRGALVMVWQLFTALGIMFGYLSGVVFANIQQGNNALQQMKPCSAADDVLAWQCTLNWRLMIGSPMVAPILLCMYIYVQPESPRWLLNKAQTALDNDQNEKAANLLNKVFLSLVKLRGGIKVKAARDMLIIDVLLWQQKCNKKNKSPGLLRALFKETRNLSALRASAIVMFLQQYCGINVLIYYSTLVLFENGGSDSNTGEPPQLFDTSVPKFIVASFGVGAINFFFGLPASLVIDKWGRRTLLLWTLLPLALFQAFVAIASVASAVNRTAFILMGMYLFAAAYSPGLGPVPFVYASESFPQATRELGMGVVTSINWILNFAVAISFPPMTEAMQFAGAFWFYAAFCVLGFWLVFFLVPETKDLELEQLDRVFEKSTMDIIQENLKTLRVTMSHLPRLGRGSEDKSPSVRQEDSNGEDDIEMRPMPIRRQTTNGTSSP